MKDQEVIGRYTVSIHEMPTAERPRERLMQHGPGALATAELLAIQLRTGTRERSALGVAEQLMTEFSDLRGIANATVQELSRVKGVGPVKAVQIACAMELGKRLQLFALQDRPTIREPQDVAALLMPDLRDAQKEHFVAVLLDTKNRVIKKPTISVGILDTSLVHPREVFREAIAASAAAIIAVHNHPSGDPTPSGEDRRVTQRLVEAGTLLGIDVLDHIVIGDNRWVSLKERGMM